MVAEGRRSRSLWYRAGWHLRFILAHLFWFQRFYSRLGREGGKEGEGEGEKGKGRKREREGKGREGKGRQNKTRLHFFLLLWFFCSI
jgi:hypothetical protein